MKHIYVLVCVAVILVGCSKTRTEIPIGSWEKTGDVTDYMKFTLFSGRAEVVFAGEYIKFPCELRGRLLFVPTKARGWEDPIEIASILDDGSLSVEWVPGTIDDSGQSPYLLKKISTIYPSQQPQAAVVHRELQSVGETD